MILREWKVKVTLILTDVRVPDVGLTIMAASTLSNFGIRGKDISVNRKKSTKPEPDVLVYDPSTSKGELRLIGGSMSDDWNSHSR